MSMANNLPRPSSSSDSQRPGGLSPILSQSSSQPDLQQTYPPRVTQRPIARRGSSSSVFSISSIGTATEFRPGKDYGGSGASSSAIAALLETPGINTRSTAPRPKPGDIPPVTLTQIPRLKPKEFAAYLGLAAEFDRYRRAKEHGQEEQLRLQPQSPSGSVRSPSPARSIAGSIAGTENGSVRRPSRVRKGSIAVTPLSTVPTVYFDENFHLENPRTFDVVSERSDVIRSTEQGEGAQQRKALATNAILQEKLSWYMDTVEMHLISSISTASSSFFVALGDLRELHSEAAASVHKIHALRKELVKLDEEQAVKGLEIVRLRRKRDNVRKLDRAVKQMERVVNALQAAEDGLEVQDIEGACDKIQETEGLLEGTGEEGLIDLRGVKAMEAVSADVSLLRWRVGKAFENRFVDCLLSDLRRHVEKVPSTETLRRFAQSFQREQYQRTLISRNDQHPPRSSSLPAEYTVMSESLRAQLMKHLEGLQRVKHVSTGVQAYRDAVIKEAKNLIRRHLPSDDDADSIASSMTSRSRGMRSSADKSQSLTRALRALGPHDAEDLLVRIYTSVSELIRRLATQQKMLLDVTMQMGETGVGGLLSPRLEQNGFGGITNGDASERPSSSGADSITPMDISDLISAAAEVAQSNINKVIKVRTEQVSRYPPDMLLRYTTLNRLFIQECEAVSVRAPGSGLQNTVSSQIKEFLSTYIDGKRSLLAEGLQTDRWAAKEFEESKQNGIDRIVEAASKEPDEWLKAGRLWELRTDEDASTTISALSNGLPNGNSPAPSDDTTTASTTPAATPAPNGRAKPLTPFHIAGTPFILPDSALLLLRELESYLLLLTNIPSITSEISTGMLQYISLFNSRTYQLIIGAGATKSAGLKSITTRHLAIASQSLSAIVKIAPYIRDTVKRAGGVGDGYDKLVTETKEYQNEIHLKLVNIMRDRARIHAGTMKKLDWDRPCERPNVPTASLGVETDRESEVESVEDEGTKYYLYILCHETMVLHKVLVKFLPKDQVQGIMAPVFGDYAVRLVEGFATSVGGVRGRARMLRDANYFADHMRDFHGFGNTGEIVLEAVRNKVIVDSSPHSNTNGDREGRNSLAVDGTGLGSRPGSRLGSPLPSPSPRSMSPRPNDG